MTTDRPAIEEEKEIEVTPAMIEAGDDAIYKYLSDEAYRDMGKSHITALLRDVYESMSRSR